MTRSKGTNKGSAKINFKKIADYVDTEKIVSAPKQTKDDRIYIEIVSSSKKNSRKKRIYALPVNGLRGYALIETVRGKDFFQCIYFGAKCTKNFWKRVCGYHIGTRKSAKYKFAVSFYEKKRQQRC